MPNEHGILNVNKPPRITSRRVVDRVARLVKPAKVGHAGTLDPLATGVLLVAVGAATRLIEYVHRLPKRYRALVRFGARSATDDVESPLEHLPIRTFPSPPEVQAALNRFLGRLEQRPPTYSAVHIQGRRAYDLARRGQTVIPQPKSVEIHQLDLLTYHPSAPPQTTADPAPQLPWLELDILCGSGTYVRSLARDLGEHLGCGGVLQELTRTAIGPFHLHDAVETDRLTAETWKDFLHPSLDALPDLPRCTLPHELLRRLAQGQSIPFDTNLPSTESATRPADDSPRTPATPSRAAAELAVLDTRGRLIAIAVADDTTGRIRPQRVLLRP